VRYMLATVEVPDQERLYYAGPMREIVGRMAGMFVHPKFPGGLQVAKSVAAEDVPGYEPGTPIDGPVIAPVDISLREIRSVFPSLPIYHYVGDQLVKFGVDPAEVYKA
jgi:hypothetical protein